MLPRRTNRTIFWLGLLAIVCPRGTVSAEEPRVLIEGARLELIASEPEIVTPVGMAFDSAGRLLVIESHTHKRPADYAGPAADRVLLFSDSDGDGKLDKSTVFAAGFQQSMNLLAAGPGRVYLVTRRSVDLLIDDDQDGTMDRQESVLRLETPVDYPHNALSGIAHDGKGGLLVGMGENLGAQYTLTGSDGSSYSDHGGVGTIFQCTAAGGKLRRFCNGFWNPFSLCVLPGGQVFAVDNDPDSSPPCRLIHAVESGDYGHRWEYSRSGIHPLQAWNGELPGTLPMLAGTGEAPCAVLPHRGALWVTSWGDHRLERYRLEPQGASFTAKQKIAVQGDSDFRPTGCAVAADGSLYFADWVDHSYPVHGKGRIWRLSFNGPTDSHSQNRKTRSSENGGGGFAMGTKNQAPFPPQPRGNLDWDALIRSADLFERQQAILAQPQALDTGKIASESATERLVRAQALRWSRVPVTDGWLRRQLGDTDSSVRLYAVRWIADERKQSLRDDVADLLEGEIPDQQYYLAVLSALEWLDGEPGVRQLSLNDGLLARELKKNSRSPKLQELALRLISADHPWLTPERLRQYLHADSQPLRLEAIRTLALQSRSDRFELLAEVARDVQQSEEVRAQAVAGLAATETFTEALAALAKDKNRVVRQEAQRVERLMGQRPLVAETKPTASDLQSWNEILAAPGDAAAGRRLFFSARGARCGVCHQVGGRGGKIGPDLSRLGHSNSRPQIIASILQPSREIAPHYQPWVLQTEAGKTLVGLRLHKSGDRGKEIYADSHGETFELASEEIAVRQASDLSIMPAGLEKSMSIDELRDLVEFLVD